MGRLCEHGLEAVAVDDPNFIALIMAMGTYRVRVAVPDEEAEEARRVLADWDREAAPKVAALSKTVQRQFLIASLVVLVCLAGLLLFSEGLGLLLVLAVPATFLAVMMALGLIERLRGGTRADDDSA